MGGEGAFRIARFAECVGGVGDQIDAFRRSSSFIIPSEY